MCDGNGNCVQCNTDADCGTSCGNGMLTTSTCTAHVCVAGSPTPCQGGYICASASTCKTSCSLDTDCESSNDYCAGGLCNGMGGTGATCSADDQCTSGHCGPNGGTATGGTGTHCCAPTTTCSATVAACAATDCGPTGACVYPGNTIAPASLQGNVPACQKIVCDGNGGDTQVDDPTDLPTPTTPCEINPACCGPSPLTPCFDPAPTTTSCTLASDPAAHVCGDPNNSNIARTCVECNTDADCLFEDDAGTLACDTASGMCQ